MDSRKLILLSTLVMASTGCQAIGDIFKAGIWVGVLAVVVLVAVIAGIVRLVAK